MPAELETFTAPALMAWMLADIGDVGRALGWVEYEDFEPIIRAGLRSAGLESVELATDDEDWLLAHARLALWRAARRGLATAVNLRYPDGESVDEGAVRTNAAAEAADALIEVNRLTAIRARALLPAALTRTRIHRRDPFADPLGANRRRRGSRAWWDV